MQAELHLSEEQVPAHVCYLDGKRIESRAHHVIGFSLRALLWPAMAGYSLWIQAEDGRYWNDKRLTDTTTIPMGARIYHLPPIFGYPSSDYAY